MWLMPLIEPRMDCAGARNALLDLSHAAAMDDVSNLLMRVRGQTTAFHAILCHFCMSVLQAGAWPRSHARPLPFMPFCSMRLLSSQQVSSHLRGVQCSGLNHKTLQTLNPLLPPASRAAAL
jgi:hypothetical protein